MSTSVTDIDKTAKANAKAVKYVYFFGDGHAEGHGKMKDELGGKGAGLAEMTNAGLPVPPGFTIQTEACREYMRNNSVSKEVNRQMDEALRRLESLQGQKLGAADNPLLVSVRSGAKFSMPGMMDTILNLGLNDKSVEGLAKRSNNPRFAYDSYRRLIQMFGSVVLDIDKKAFEEVFDGKKKQKKTKLDTDLDAKALQEVITEYKKVVQKHAKREFPQDPHEQLVMSRDAVFRSWLNDRAKTYRRINNIDDMLGTAVNVQAMVFGNLGETSGTGVGFTRNPATGVKEFYGEFLMNAQGEDVVSGVRTPIHISELEKIQPDVYNQLREITTRLEKHYRDMQDFEFTIQDGRLYMLQTRNGKRTGRAAVRVAIQMVEEGLISKEEAIFRVEPNQLYDFLVPSLDEKGKDIDVLATGLPASPGAAVGQIVFTADEAVEKFNQDSKAKLILVRSETTPEDIGGMEVAAGILTSRGGMTSHAAVVTRGMGKCCVAGAGDIDVDEKAGEMRVRGKVLKEGDWISLDGASGRVINGKLNTVPAKPDDPELQNAHELGRAFPPHGCACQRGHTSGRSPGASVRRRGHWAVPHRAHVLRRGPPAAHADHDSGQHREGPPQCVAQTASHAAQRFRRRLPRHGWISGHNPHHRSAAARVPAAPRRPDGGNRQAGNHQAEIAQAEGAAHAAESRGAIARGQSHARASRLPAGHHLSRDHGNAVARHLRSCRQGGPARREGEARGHDSATGGLNEMANQAAIVRRVAEEVFAEKEYKVEYLVGTMIELPRAALVADEIAKEAEFFSFGTNDLTQTTFGFSRDDINKFLPKYLELGILKQDPFAVLDREGVGQLLKMAVEKGRKTRPTIKIGICGEHGGEPSSVEFCAQLGFNYVSCSPFRVLTARLAAAQAGASAELKIEGGRTK